MTCPDDIDESDLRSLYPFTERRVPADHSLYMSIVIFLVVMALIACLYAATRSGT